MDSSDFRAGRWRKGGDRWRLRSAPRKCFQRSSVSRARALKQMDTLIRWSLRNRALVLAASGLLLVLGIFTVARMPVDVFPDLTAPTVTVITEAHGMAPTEVENQVTLPIDSSLNGAQDVRRVRSSTVV